MYLLYSLLSAAAMVVLLPYFALRGWRQGKYWGSIRQRLGYLPKEVSLAVGAEPSISGAIWIHAVSVGEALAALPLARRLKKHFPDRRLAISTTTATGQRVARERFDFADAVFYFPLDWTGPAARTLRAIRPAIVIILETEIWPNFLRVARRSGVPVVFVNGRVSERSFRRYRWVNGMLARVLCDAEAFLTQSEDDARRLRALGAPADRVEVMGNLKYDLAAPSQTPLADWLESELRRLNHGPLLVAGSVVAGEEELVLEAFSAVKQKWPAALMVLAPRKPERFEAAARIAIDRGWKIIRRSSLTPGGPLDAVAEIFLLDSVGELAALYRIADAVFVGGSLVPAGGHNILEPALFGRGPIFGPSMTNFQEIAAQFLTAGAAIQVTTPKELSTTWIAMLEDAARRERMGAIAQGLIERNRGATDHAFERIVAILQSSRGLA